MHLAAVGGPLPFSIELIKVARNYEKTVGFEPLASSVTVLGISRVFLSSTTSVEGSLAVSSSLFVSYS